VGNALDPGFLAVVDISVDFDAVAVVVSKGNRGRQRGNRLDGILSDMGAAPNDFDEGGFASSVGMGDESASSNGTEFGGCLAMHADEFALAERG